METKEKLIVAMAGLEKAMNKASGRLANLESRFDAIENLMEEILCQSKSTSE